MDFHRPALQRSYAEAYRSNGVDALLFPTPLVAPSLKTAADIAIAGRTVSVLDLAENVFPSSFPATRCRWAFLRTACRWDWRWTGMPGEDVKLLGLAVLGSIPAPRGV